MKPLQTSPLHIFFIFEHLPIIFFTSKANSTNHYNYYTPVSYLYPLTVYITHELTLTNNFLVDLSAVDLEKTTQNWIFKKFTKIFNKLLFFITYFCYNSKIRITWFSLIKKQSNKCKIFSLETLIFNANWLEREVSEMFGIYFYNKLDSRNLLLEYSSFYTPLKKNFPCEGYFEIYYNFFNQNITQLDIEHIEL